MNDTELVDELTRLHRTFTERRDSARYEAIRRRAEGELHSGAAVGGKAVAYNEVLVELSNLLGVALTKAPSPGSGNIVQHTEAKRGGITPGKRAQVFKADGRKCHYCGVRPYPAELEHVVPRTLGGTNAFHNLVVACESCNDAKGTALFPDHCASCAIAVRTWMQREVELAMTRYGQKSLLQIR